MDAFVVKQYVTQETVAQRSRFTRKFPIVAAGTVLPKFLKFWSPPHDLALFLIIGVHEPFGHALFSNDFED